MKIGKSYIIGYYNKTQNYYKIFWHRNKSLAMHYGLWDTKIHNIDDALINENKVLSNISKIKSTDYVLDAGCGIGGSSIWLAKNLGVKVVGISIAKGQIEAARKYAEENKVDKLTDFREMDFCKTPFDDKTFDVVWAIESVCHSKNKLDFLAEAKRILKVGGRLIVADGFLRRSNFSNEDKKVLDAFLKGLAVPNLAEIEDFKKQLMQLGFKKVEFFDKSKNALPSSKRMYKMCRMALPISKVLLKLKIIDNIIFNNILAGISQYEGAKRNLWAYGVFLAKK